MGFPEAGNPGRPEHAGISPVRHAVAVPVIAEVARIMKPHIMALVEQEQETPQARLFAA